MEINEKIQEECDQFCDEIHKYIIEQGYKIQRAHPELVHYFIMNALMNSLSKGAMLTAEDPTAESITKYYDHIIKHLEHIKKYQQGLVNTGRLFKKEQVLQ